MAQRPDSRREFSPHHVTNRRDCFTLTNQVCDGWSEPFHPCRPCNPWFDPGEGVNVSIVRIGLAETKKFAEGYDAIFGKRQPASAAKPKKKPAKKPARAKAKASKKKSKK